MVPVEEAVAVLPVLGLAVFREQSQQPSRLALREVQLLLGDARAALCVFWSKVFPGDGIHHVVGLAEDEVPYEVRLRHVEDTVVEDDVHAFGGLLAAYGGVAVKLIDLLPRRAGEQRHAYAVPRGRDGLSGTRYCRENAQQEAQEYGNSLKHGRKGTTNN